MPSNTLMTNALNKDKKCQNLIRFFSQKRNQGDVALSLVPRSPSRNTIYAVRSLHFALPYFVPLRSAKHQIYINVIYRIFTVKKQHKNFYKILLANGQNWRGSRGEKFLPAELLANLFCNFASIGVRILLKKGSDFVQ